MSDSNYTAATRHRKPNSTAGRPPSLKIVDDEWAADHLSDDEVDCHQHEASIQPLLGDIDVDAIVVSTGHTESTQNDADRKKTDRWNDLGLDRFDTPTTSTNNNDGSNN